MARYVVIEFYDNDDAEEFIKATNELNADARDERLSFRRRVVGVFVKPGKTCTCWDASHINYGDKNREHGVAKGERFGWWVCTRCNKPRAAGHQLVNQVKLSECYEGVIYNNYEFQVDGLQVSGIHTDQVDRPKKLRRKKPKKG